MQVWAVRQWNTQYSIFVKNHATSNKDFSFLILGGRLQMIFTAINQENVNAEYYFSVKINPDHTYTGKRLSFQQFTL